MGERKCAEARPTRAFARMPSRASSSARSFIGVAGMAFTQCQRTL